MIEAQSILDWPDTDVDTIQLRCDRYFSRHPEVWTEIVHLVALAQDRGDQRVSMNAIFEAVRRKAPRDGDSPVALNNDFRAPATRRIIAEHPEFQDLFRMRRRIHGANA